MRQTVRRGVAERLRDLRLTGRESQQMRGGHTVMSTEREREREIGGTDYTATAGQNDFINAPDAIITSQIAAAI